MMLYIFFILVFASLHILCSIGYIIVDKRKVLSPEEEEIKEKTLILLKSIMRILCTLFGAQIGGAFAVLFGLSRLWRIIYCVAGAWIAMELSDKE